MAAADAVRQVGHGEMIVLPTGVGEPPALLTALSEQRRDFRGVRLTQILPLRKFGYFDPDTVEHVRHVAMFFSGASRPGGQEGWIDFIPCSFSEIPALIRRGLVPADVVFSLASPMDENGFFSLGLAADYTMSAIAKARAVVLEVNPHVPCTQGDCRVHISRVAALAESEEPVLEVGMPTVGPVQETIAKYVADLVPDGATLQIGYGDIPSAVIGELAGKRDLGVHSEMLGDGILSLVESGAITNRRKNRHPGKILGTFALGSQKLYRFMHRNPALELHPVDFTNDPFLAGQNDNLIAINGTMQVDLIGQCGSESLGSSPYSGSGGQIDFVRAANRSEGGKAIIVMPSTAKGGSISRVVPILSPGTHVTTGKNDVNYVVTEYGVAQLRGKSARARAEALIGIAHPDFRGELRVAAKRMKLL